MKSSSFPYLKEKYAGARLEARDCAAVTLKLLFVNQFFWPDTAATGQLLTDVARAVVPGNGPVSVLCGMPDYGAVDASPAPLVTILRCGPARFSRGKMRRVVSYASFLGGAAWKAFRAPRADVVVTLTTPPLVSLLGTALKAMRGSRHYIWEMDVYPDIAVDLGVLKRGSVATRAIGAAADWSRRRADGIVALGEEMKSRLMARGVPEHKIHVAENWADGREIVPLAFPEGPLVVHYSGNLGLAHDVETIAAAMKGLRGDGRVRFVFAGGGPRRRWLEEFCKAEGIDGAEFRGYARRADLGRSLGEGHVGLVTQLPETCGAVVPSKTYGIMAAGRPVLYVGPRGATPARIVERHGCGWRVEPGDGTGLAQLLKRLAENPALVREAGARARRAFDDNYDRPLGVARILAILGLESSEEETSAFIAHAAQDCFPSHEEHSISAGREGLQAARIPPS
jgi:colanic acid biosynthesis glycosyl transferase WcaI